MCAHGIDPPDRAVFAVAYPCAFLKLKVFIARFIFPAYAPHPKWAVYDFIIIALLLFWVVLAVPAYFCVWFHFLFRV